MTLGLSSCPNDTFIFFGLLHGKVDLPCSFSYCMADVEDLNRKILEESLDCSKVSHHLYGQVTDKYIMLRAGHALGRGCGPLLLARKPAGIMDNTKSSIAVPGRHTTAALLLHLFFPDHKNLVEMNFSKIPEAIARGDVDGGVIIHESRFTYQALDLVCIQDLGQWWESETGLPIPLGGIAARRSLGTNMLRKIDSAIRASIEYAYENPDDTIRFVKRHAQEMSCSIMHKHIALYVNQFTLDIGREGEKALEYLLELGRQKGVFPGKKKKGLPVVLPASV